MRAAPSPTPTPTPMGTALDEVEELVTTGKDVELAVELAPADAAVDAGIEEEVAVEEVAEVVLVEVAEVLVEVLVEEVLMEEVLVEEEVDVALGLAKTPCCPIMVRVYGSPAKLTTPAPLDLHWQPSLQQYSSTPVTLQLNMALPRFCAIQLH